MAKLHRVLAVLSAIGLSTISCVGIVATLVQMKSFLDTRPPNMAETDCCILHLMQQLGKLKENHEIVNQYEPDETILTIQTYKQQLLSIFCVPVCQEFLNMKFTL